MEINDLISALRKYVSSGKHCVILPHVGADGDCLGSALAFCRFMNHSGLEASIILEEPVPEKYNYLEKGAHFSIHDGKPIVSDFIVCLDTGDFKRLGERGKALQCGIDFNIDHHKTNSGFAKINYIDTTVSSTGEIVYKIMAAEGFEFDKITSEGLFTAISTDTGGLRYSNTTPESMRICAHLLETGIDIGEISHRAFDMTPYPKLMLKCRAIEKMRLHCSGHIAVISLRKEDFSFLGGKDEYFDGIVNITVNTEGVLTGALLRETDAGIKVNLRSNTDAIDVSEIADSYGGGGHHRAAGCTVSSKDMDEVTKQITDILCKAVGQWT